MLLFCCCAFCCPSGEDEAEDDEDGDDDPGDKYCAIRCDADDSRPPWPPLGPDAPGIWLAPPSKPGIEDD